MNNQKSNKSFEDIYQESKLPISKRDKIELITDFISKLKELSHEGFIIIDELKKDI